MEFDMMRMMRDITHVLFIFVPVTKLSRFVCSFVSFVSLYKNSILLTPIVVYSLKRLALFKPSIMCNRWVQEKSPRRRPSRLKRCKRRSRVQSWHQLTLHLLGISVWHSRNCRSSWWIRKPACPLRKPWLWLWKDVMQGHDKSFLASVWCFGDDGRLPPWWYFVRRVVNDRGG
jgi:hypothetical protein